MPDWNALINQGPAVVALAIVFWWAGPRIDRLITSHLELIKILGERLIHIDITVDAIDQKLSDRLNRHSDAIKSSDGRLSKIERAALRGAEG